MRVLHLFSNAKWTGPAEPALNLCVALRARGVETDFACAPDAGASVNKVVETARDRGIEPILQFHLSKHRRPIKNLADRLALARYLRAHPYDLIHCHLDNDHRIAAPVGRELGIPLVRSSYEGTGFQHKRTYVKLLPRTAWLIEPSNLAAEHDAEVYGFPRERMRVIPGAVDTERFDPQREAPDARRWLGIPHDAFVAGIVARLQPHRRYEDFFGALRLLVDAVPNVRAIVVGRGANHDEVARKPIQALGLAPFVHLPGYVGGENYVGMLKAFDAKVYLAPGSDGTCRAVREAMAMGKPAVVADRGMLREIVDDGTTGIAFDGTPEALFGALRRLASDRQRTRAMGCAAREKALRDYSLPVQARAVLDVYHAVLGLR